MLLKIADALKASGADGATTAEVMDLLGKKVALKLIPALKDGSAAFLQMGKDAEIMSNETIAAMDAADDRFDKMVKGWKSKLANQAVGLADFFSGENKKPISTPALTGAELKKARADQQARKAAAGGDPSPVHAPYNEDRFGVRGLKPIGYNTGLQGASMESLGKFVTAFTPSLAPAPTMLGGGSGGIGAAHGVIRQGDRQRAKAAAAAAKSAEEQQLEKLNQKMDDYWGDR